jgi:hypothetical protein
MKEGEPVLGGPQANPGSTAPSNNFGPQPAGSGSGLPQMPIGNLASQPSAPFYGTSQFSAFSNNSMATSQPNAPTLQPNTPTSQSNTATSFPFSQPQQPSMRPLVQPSAQSIPHDTGDIILSPAQPQKNKKRFILPIFLLAIALVVAIIAIFFAFGSHSGQTNSSPTLAGSFNRYANLVVYGTDSTEPIQGEYQDNISYTIDNFATQNTSSEKTEYFQKVLQLWDIYYGNFEKSDYFDEFNSSINHFTFLLNDSIVFATKIDSLSTFDKNKIFEMFISEGESNTRNTISEYYSSSLSQDNSLLTQYAELLIARDNAMVDQIAVYNNAGCIKDGVIDNNCTMTLDSSSSEKYIEAYQAEVDSRQDIFSLIYSNYNHVLEWTYLLSGFLNNNDVPYWNGGQYEI